MGILDIFKKIAALFVALSVVLSATTAGSVIGYTDGTPKTATRRNYCFDNNRLIIGGYNLNNTSKTEQVVKYAKEAGLDFVIAGSTSENLLNLCDEYDLGVIASSYNKNAPYAYWSAGKEVFNKWTLITDETYNYSHKCIWGDNLIDEPTSAVFGDIETACSSYYANVKGKLPFVNLFPMYANAEQLGNSTEKDETATSLFWRHDDYNESVDQYKLHVSDYINTIDTDYICVDIYPLRQTVKNGNIKKETYNLWLRNLDILSEACRETNRDLWVITQSAGETATESGTRFCDTPADIRWQMYVSLAFGAKALIHACFDGGWWSRDSHCINANGDRTDTYYAVQKVNSELMSFRDIYGKYENKGAYLVNGILASGNLTNTLTPLDSKYKLNVKSESPLLIGSFTETEGDGRAYSIVNMWEPQTGFNAKANIVFAGATEITVYQKGVQTVVNGDTLTLNLENSEGVFVTVK